VNWEIFFLKFKSIYHVVFIIISIASGGNFASRLERTFVDDGRSDARTQSFGSPLFDEFHMEIIASVFGFRYGLSNVSAVDHSDDFVALVLDAQ
jgi:hypothetical protein